jgi:hypothetical protein
MINILNIKEIKEKLSIKDDINYSFQKIEEFCSIANLKIVKASPNFFIAKDKNVEEHLKSMVGTMDNITIFYQDNNKRHPSYNYFSFLCIQTSDIVELKKMLKICKLKAFL